MPKIELYNDDINGDPTPSFATDAEIETADRLRRQLEERYLTREQIRTDGQLAGHLGVSAPAAERWRCFSLAAGMGERVHPGEMQEAQSAVPESTRSGTRSFDGGVSGSNAPSAVVGAGQVVAGTQTRPRSRVAAECKGSDWWALQGQLHLRRPANGVDAGR